MLSTYRKRFEEELCGWDPLKERQEPILTGSWRPRTERIHVAVFPVGTVPSLLPINTLTARFSSVQVCRARASKILRDVTRSIDLRVVSYKLFV